jgi:7-carboxy-7-deazaguanine synthase (Cx14CxxC type)
MSYAVKEIFKTLQGEGAQAGRPAVFCRFAGCNLACSFCDTDFTGGDSFATAQALVDAIEQEWQGPAEHRFVVLTGGEPLLQVDAPLIEQLHARGFEIAIETNGTLGAPAGIDWLCVSPKSRDGLTLQRGDELKLVYPQDDVPPEVFVHLPFRRFSLQPMDGPALADNTARAIAYCLAHPQWQLSLQTHKYLGIR